MCITCFVNVHCIITNTTTISLFSSFSWLLSQSMSPTSRRFSYSLPPLPARAQPRDSPTPSSSCAAAPAIASQFLLLYPAAASLPPPAAAIAARGTTGAPRQRHSGLVFPPPRSPTLPRAPSAPAGGPGRALPLAPARSEASGGRTGPRRNGAFGHASRCRPLPPSLTARAPRGRRSQLRGAPKRPWEDAPVQPRVSTGPARTRVFPGPSPGRPQPRAAAPIDVTVAPLPARVACGDVTGPSHRLPV